MGVGKKKGSIYRLGENLKYKRKDKGREGGKEGKNSKKNSVQVGEGEGGDGEQLCTADILICRLTTLPLLHPVPAWITATGPRHIGQIISHMHTHTHTQFDNNNISNYHSFHRENFKRGDFDWKQK